MTELAQVSIWAESLIGVDGAIAPRGTWMTVTTTVVWSNRDWKLIALGGYSGGADGPVPIVTQPSMQSNSLPAQLREFREYRQGLAPG